MQNLVEEFKTFLEKNKDPERAEKEKAYLYSSFVHYGVPVQKRRLFIKPYKKSIKKLSKKEALELAQTLWEQPSFAEKGLSLTVLGLHKEKLDASDVIWIEEWIRQSKGWALLDSLVIPLMPEILQKDKSTFKYLKKWIKDDDFWVRRSALLAQILFFRENKGDKKLFFELAKSQFDETWIDNLYKDKLQNKRAKFFIRKAIGWTLREMSAKNPECVYTFLKENKSEMSGLSFREGSRKLPEKYIKKLR